MEVSIGIRREDKNRWERRSPIIPDHVKQLIREHNFHFVVQPGSIRVFSESEYKNAGADISEDLSTCSAIFAVKEIPQNLILKNKVYIFFSHTIKGQSYNMSMLQKLLDQKCTLIDYELIVDKTGRRLVFFGNYAGLAGMIDSFWALGQRLHVEGFTTPFLNIQPAHKFTDLHEAKESLIRIGEQIKTSNLPAKLCPMIFGFAGYGNVSRGAQEIFDLMPYKEINARDLVSNNIKNLSGRNLLYKVVFKEEDTVVPKVEGKSFDLKEYYSFPDRYVSRFKEYIPFLTILMNCIYWEPKYPRLVSKQNIKDLFKSPHSPALRVIGDISCDVNGSIECTLKCTTPENPVYVYDSKLDASIDGVKGMGPVILAIDHLPCELPKESSEFFSKSLLPYIPIIAGTDYSRAFADLALEPIIKNALIIHQGQLTPRFTYLEKYLRQ
ncbi:MAG: hypothetical protein A2161_21940 [Candidatus Schekmanbacteria bacterium RBG_13_48_7]|uniref:Alanine dehydrogenase/pyridine nucleotide transhydrogenase N-terminal domain-containing protein n=1 Tax=Candidatus Schekmanbacteria bacterium RBG_13_48_7 TaxID=1817878 RepID=A0A1F7RYN8_9BACT|nr:MAG: hypothetical protein A2161_21940 [Candidatus Schekmanbacteria bacterium RBG_13_48_7]